MIAAFGLRGSAYFVLLNLYIQMLGFSEIFIGLATGVDEHVEARIS